MGGFNPLGFFTLSWTSRRSWSEWMRSYRRNTFARLIQGSSLWPMA